MTNLLISVFIPTGNRAEALYKALTSLVDQTYNNFEVIIVDYKSKDTTMYVIESLKNKLSINLLHQTNKGLSRAANLALNVAKGEIFIRTDDDVIMSPQWLEAINETFNIDPLIGGVTGPTIVPKNYIHSRDLFSFQEKFKSGNAILKIVGKIYFDYLLEGNPYKVSHWYKSGAFSIGSNYETSLGEDIQEVNNLEACNFAVRTELLKKIGGFDSTFGGIGDYHEPDAVFKIAKLGYKLMFNPKAMLNHCPSQDGFFTERPSSYPRMMNFLRFYFLHIKPNTFDKFLRFCTHLLFLNAYYGFLALQKKQFKQLGAIPATFVGFFRNVI